MKLRILLSELACSICLLFVFSLGVLVLVSGVFKVVHGDAFARTLASHGVFSDLMVNSLGRVFPVFEIIVGGLCVVFVIQGFRGSIVSGQILGSLFLAFCVYSLLVSFEPPAEPVICGCGWSSEPVEAWGWLALRNATLGVLAFCCSIALMVFAKQKSVTK